MRGGNWYARGHEEVLTQIIRHYRLMGVERPLLNHESFCEPLVGLFNTALMEGDLRLVSYLYHAYLFLESHEPYTGMEDLGALQPVPPRWKALGVLEDESDKLVQVHVAQLEERGSLSTGETGLRSGPVCEISLPGRIDRRTRKDRLPAFLVLHNDSPYRTVV